MGRGRRGGERSRGAHLGQPAHRGPAAHPRRRRARRALGGPDVARGPGRRRARLRRRARPSARDRARASGSRGRAISWWSPARATRTTRSSAPRSGTSTTARRCGARSEQRHVSELERARAPRGLRRSTRCWPRPAASSRGSATARTSPGSRPTRRTLRPGELFVAIRGERTTGMPSWLDAAARRGAGAVMVGARARRSSPVAAAWSWCATRLAALGDLAAFHRRRLPRRASLAVTGSNGKTTTKEMLAAILARALGADRRAAHARHAEQPGRPAAHAAAPRRRPQRVAVVELGMNGPGEIWRLAEIADPDVGVITYVAPAHLEGLGSMHGVARGEGRALPAPASLGHRGRERRRSAGGRARRRVPGAGWCRFGTDGGDVRAEDVADASASTAASSAASSGSGARRVRLAGPGPAQRRQRARRRGGRARRSASRSTPCAPGSRPSQPPGMRMQVDAPAERRHGDQRRLQRQSGVDGGRPAHARAASAGVAAAGGARRDARAGDRTEAAHERARRVAAACAPRSRSWCSARTPPGARRRAVAAGMPAARIVLVATDHADAAARLRDFCRAGDLVLLKGSRGASARVGAGVTSERRGRARDALRAALPICTWNGRRCTSSSTSPSGPWWRR